MSKATAQFVGQPCGHHGQYRFYRAFTLESDGLSKVLSLGEFFFVRISAHDDPCIGELQLLWEDKTNKQFLTSVRLYFLPEQLPEGRQSFHGEHEVVAASDKVILRLQDLVSWIVDFDVDWMVGLQVPVSLRASQHLSLPFRSILNNVPATNGRKASGDAPEISCERFDEKTLKHGKSSEVMVLSYPRYCRYRALIKRFESSNDSEETMNKENSSQAAQSDSEKNILAGPMSRVTASILSSRGSPASSASSTEPAETSGGGAPNATVSSTTSTPTSTTPNTKTTTTLATDKTKSPVPIALPVDKEVSGCVRILFCRETFEHEGLLHHDLVCDHLAPKLKGRPRKRANRSAVSARSSSPESNTSEDSGAKLRSSRAKKSLKNRNGANGAGGGSSALVRTRKSAKSAPSPPLSPRLVEKCVKNEQEFLKQLYKFMKERNTPIQRIPHLGFKKVDLYYLYTFSRALGGYDEITTNKSWKKVYDELGGDPRSTSAATCTRRHYERLLLPFERAIDGARLIDAGEEAKDNNLTKAKGIAGKRGRTAKSKQKSKPASSRNSRSRTAKTREAAMEVGAEEGNQSADESSGKASKDSDDESSTGSGLSLKEPAQKEKPEQTEAVKEEDVREFKAKEPLVAVKREALSDTISEPLLPSKESLDDKQRDKKVVKVEAINGLDASETKASPLLSISSLVQSVDSLTKFPEKVREKRPSLTNQLVKRPPSLITSPGRFTVSSMVNDTLPRQTVIQKSEVKTETLPPHSRTTTSPVVLQSPKLCPTDVTDLHRIEKIKVLKPPSAHLNSRLVVPTKRTFEKTSSDAPGEVLDLSIKKRLSEADSRMSPSKLPQEPMDILDLTLKRKEVPMFPVKKEIPPVVQNVIEKVTKNISNGFTPVSGRQMSPFATPVSPKLETVTKKAAAPSNSAQYSELLSTLQSKPANQRPASNQSPRPRSRQSPQVRDVRDSSSRRSPQQIRVSSQTKTSSSRLPPLMSHSETASFTRPAEPQPSPTRSREELAAEETSKAIEFADALYHQRLQQHLHQQNLAHSLSQFYANPYAMNNPFSPAISDYNPTLPMFHMPYASSFMDPSSSQSSSSPSSSHAQSVAAQSLQRLQMEASASHHHLQQQQQLHHHLQNGMSENSLYRNADLLNQLAHQYQGQQMNADAVAAYRKMAGQKSLSSLYPPFYATK